MNFYEALDRIMKQDVGGRGLLATLPLSPLKEITETLSAAKRVILLTGFPVRLPDGSWIGETDGPLGSADLAAALTALGCHVLVVTDRPSYGLLQAALCYRAPQAELLLLPEEETNDWIRQLIQKETPTHLISLERPGLARDGHYHNMRGMIIDEMVTDSSLFLSEAKKAGAVTVSIGDGGNEMGMGSFRSQIECGVPCGAKICAEEGADLALASGVSNWWGLGIASLLSVKTGQNLLPSVAEEAELLRQVVQAGGVDGCTGENTCTVDHLSLEVNLSILQEVAKLTERELSRKIVAFQEETRKRLPQKPALIL